MTHAHVDDITDQIISFVNASVTAAHAEAYIIKYGNDIIQEGNLETQRLLAEKEGYRVGKLIGSSIYDRSDALAMAVRDYSEALTAPIKAKSLSDRYFNIVVALAANECENAKSTMIRLGVDVNRIEAECEEHEE